MNTHIARWKIQFDDVQKVINAMPESHDHIAEAQAEGKKIEDRLRKIEPGRRREQSRRKSLG